MRAPCPVLPGVDGLADQGAQELEGSGSPAAGLISIASRRQCQATRASPQSTACKVQGALRRRKFVEGPHAASLLRPLNTHDEKGEGRPPPRSSPAGLGSALRAAGLSRACTSLQAQLLPHPTGPQTLLLTHQTVQLGPTAPVLAAPAPSALAHSPAMQPGFAAGQAHAQAVGPLPRALRLAGSNLALGRRCRGWRRGGSTPAHATTAALPDALPDVATALGRRASPAGIKDDATQIIGNTPLVSPLLDRQLLCQAPVCAGRSAGAVSSPPCPCGCLTARPPRRCAAGEAEQGERDVLCGHCVQARNYGALLQVIGG